VKEKTSAKERRSENMRRIRSKDTQPEVAVRRLVWSLGWRYRLHRHDLPGRPDLVFSSRRRVIFIHGCFWHSHARCRRTHVPRTNQKYWISKLERNRQRDRSNMRKLRTKGWQVLVIWECEAADEPLIQSKLKTFFK
jgi:DNA mismatch endonuclease (patch repair protein)